MTATPLVLCMLRLVTVDDDGSDLIRNLDLRRCSIQKSVFDFHPVSFPPEALPGGQGTKRAGGHDGHTGEQRLGEGTSKHGGYIESQNSR